jgi:DNA-binding transcriptional LysR family regulator
MVASGLTIALVDPALQQTAAPGVVFLPLAGPGIFTETGIVYRKNDPSPILSLFLDEVREAFRHTEDAAVEASIPKRSKPRRRITARAGKAKG